MNTGRRFAVSLASIITLLPGCEDSELADSRLKPSRTWDKCILQSDSKVHFDKQEPRLYTEGISQDVTDQIDATVRQELSRHFVLNDPASDLDFIYKAEPRERSYSGTPMIVLLFCKVGQRRDEPANCTQTHAFRRLTRNFSFPEFMRDALSEEITYLLRPECTSAEIQ
jgi:hypothetical protein